MAMVADTPEKALLAAYENVCNERADEIFNKKAWNRVALSLMTELYRKERRLMILEEDARKTIKKKK